MKFEFDAMQGTVPEKKNDGYTSLENVENAMGSNESKVEFAIDALSHFLQERGAVESNNYSESIRCMAQRYPDLIVRRESPKFLMQALENDEDYKIRFDHAGDELSDPYPNAGVLGDDAYGLRIPFTRGFGKVEGSDGKVVTIAGFDVEGVDLYNHSMPDDSEKYPHYTADVRERSMVRMVEGDIPHDRLKFVLFRFPRHLFPESLMTDDELEMEEYPFISRVYEFDTETKKEH